MISKRVTQSACAGAFVALCSAATVMAQPADKRTIFTFSGPVTMPGVTLPAGKYVFRLANPESSARVVQVFSGDGKKAYGMFFSHPAERLEAAKNAEVRFMETAPGAGSAIKTWWYPGERTGFEFIYPKDQARKLAQSSKSSVLTTKAQSTTPEQTNTSSLARVSPAGDETTVETDTKTAAAQPSGVTQEGTIGDPSIAFPATSASARATRTPEQTLAANTRTSLPNTASDMPLVGMIGVLALAAAAASRLWAASVVTSVDARRFWRRPSRVGRLRVRVPTDCGVSMHRSLPAGS